MADDYLLGVVAATTHTLIRVKSLEKVKVDL